MNRSTKDLLGHHQLLEFTQIHVRRVSDAIQPSQPLSSPSPPAPSPSQRQSYFQWANSSHEVAKVLKFQPQQQSFQWTPRTGLPKVHSKNGLVGSPCSSRDSQESSPTPHCKSINTSALSFLYSPILHPYMTNGKTIALTRWTFVGKGLLLGKTYGHQEEKKWGVGGKWYLTAFLFKKFKYGFKHPDNILWRLEKTLSFKESL